MSETQTEAARWQLCKDARRRLEIAIRAMSESRQCNCGKQGVCDSKIRVAIGCAESALGALYEIADPETARIIAGDCDKGFNYIAERLRDAIEAAGGGKS